MGKGDSVTTGTIDKILYPLIQGSSQGILRQQRNEPLDAYYDRYPARTAGLDSYERYGMGMIPGMMAPDAVEGFGLQQLLRLPALYGAGPTTGFEDESSIPDLSMLLDFLQPQHEMASEFDPDRGRERNPFGPDNWTSSYRPGALPTPGEGGPPPAPGSGGYPPPGGGSGSGTGGGGHGGGPGEREIHRLSASGATASAGFGEENAAPAGAYGSLPPLTYDSRTGQTPARRLPSGRLYGPHQTSTADASGLNSGELPMYSQEEWERENARPVYDSNRGMGVIGGDTGVQLEAGDRRLLGGSSPGTTPQGGSFTEQVNALRGRSGPSLSSVPRDTGTINRTGGSVKGGPPQGGIPGWDAPGVTPPSRGPASEPRMPVVLPPHPGPPIVVGGGNPPPNGGPPGSRPPIVGNPVGGAPPSGPPAPNAPPADPHEGGDGQILAGRSGPSAGALRGVAPSRFVASPIADALGSTRSRIAEGLNSGDDPAIAAARRNFELNVAPALQNDSTLSGLGRSSSNQNALAKAWASASTPLMIDALGRGERMVEGEYGRRERSAVRTADATAQMAQGLMGYGATRNARRMDTMNAAMGAGQTRRGLQQGSYDAGYDDFTRRQALREQVQMAPFGSLSSALSGSRTRSGGLFK